MLKLLTEMINEKFAYAVCKDDISLIENYDKAIADTSQMYVCHHKAGILPCGRFSRDDLKKFNLYWHRPASELIFLTKSEHIRLHLLCKHHSEETRKKMSEAQKGKQLSEDTRKKIAEARKGKHRSAETRKKMSEAHKGKHNSAEARKKMSEAHKGNHWYNNGVTSILAKTCPEGFVPGRLKCT